MFQPFLPGLEGNCFHWKAEDLIFDPIKTIKYFESYGYYLLVDWQPENKNETYVPERVVTPSGLVIDEEELFQMLRGNFREEREEIVNAYYYYLAFCHPDIKVEDIEYRYSFIDDEDMIGAFEKYR